MNAPLPPPTTWTTGTTEVFRTGTWRAALPHHVHAPSPCHQACPVGGDIAEWIALAHARDFRAAFDVLTGRPAGPYRLRGGPRAPLSVPRTP